MMDDSNSAGIHLQQMADLIGSELRNGNDQIRLRRRIASLFSKPPAKIGRRELLSQDEQIMKSRNCAASWFAVDPLVERVKQVGAPRRDAAAAQQSA